MSSLPPCGGSGLKSLHSGINRRTRKSPSMRREWIEMKGGDPLVARQLKSPSMRREWIEMTIL